MQQGRVVVDPGQEQQPHLIEETQLLQLADTGQHHFVGFAGHAAMDVGIKTLKVDHRAVHRVGEFFPRLRSGRAVGVDKAGEPA